MKLNNRFSLRNAKYGLPLFILPFIILGVWILSTIFPPKQEISAAETGKLEGINSSLPDPALSSQQNKFALLRQLLDRRKTESGMLELEKELNNLTNDEQNSIFSELEKFIDPVSDEYKLDEINTDTEDALLALQQKYFPQTSDLFSLPAEPKSQQADELAMMREQLARMDSMLLQSQLNNNNEVKNETEKILEAVKSDSKISQNFNTLKGNKKESFITAILDEAQTVVNGSRIRIRLLDDIFIGDYLFPKGSYLYGLVSGFTAQRVNINITTVVYGDRILKINLSIYDYDGIKGLYVPQSDFRDFLQVAGSQMVTGSNVNINSNQNMMQQMAASAGQDFYRSVTRAVSQRIRQNKAKLKYASHIFLINEEQQ